MKITLEDIWYGLVIACQFLWNLITILFLIIFAILDIPSFKRKPKVYNNIYDEAEARLKKEIRSNWWEKYAKW